MQKWIAALLGVSALLSSANVLAIPCAMGTLTQYLAMDSAGCDVAGVTFADFDSLDVLGTGTQIEAGAVSVTPLQSPGNPGLSFTLTDALDAGPQELLELLIGFRVSATSALVEGNSLALLGATRVDGDGAITVVEDKCLGGQFDSPPAGCTGTPLDLIVFDIGVEADRFASLSFPGVASLAVIADLVIDGGLAGAASLPAGGGAALRFDLANQVPEPSHASLAAVALLGLAVIVARNRPRRASDSL